MDGSAQLFLGMLFGCFGMGYFIYGKKRGQFAPLLSGIGLMVFPYFVSNGYAIAVIGVALMLIPYFWRI